jgi:hypothetical protein
VVLFPLCRPAVAKRDEHTKCESCHRGVHCRSTRFWVLVTAAVGLSPTKWYGCPFQTVILASEAWHSEVLFVGDVQVPGFMEGAAGAKAVRSSPGSGK